MFLFFFDSNSLFADSTPSILKLLGLCHGSRSYLQLGEDVIGTRDANSAGTILLLGVGDLAVVDDNGVASSALVDSPANLLAELGGIISSEDLNSLVSVVRSS